MAFPKKSSTKALQYKLFQAESKLETFPHDVVSEKN